MKPVYLSTSEENFDISFIFNQYVFKHCKPIEIVKLINEERLRKINIYIGRLINLNKKLLFIRNKLNIFSQCSDLN